MKTLLLATLSAASLLAAGCIIDAHDDDHHFGGDIGPIPTDRFALTFAISFDGGTCAQTPAVDRVRLRLEGPAVADETVLCPPEGGRVFEIIPAGTYTWRIDGLNADGAVLYTATGLVDVVNRDVTVAADLLPVGGPGEQLGALAFFWTFGGLGCAEAGVAQVRVQIPDLFDEPVPCETEGVAGVAIVDLPVGATPWTLTGLDGAGAELYSASGTNTVAAGQEVQADVDLQPVDAGG